jgi:hypothetical protein
MQPACTQDHAHSCERVDKRLLTSNTVVTRLPRVWPRLATADDTALAAELPVLDAALLAALVPARPASIGPSYQFAHIEMRGSLGLIDVSCLQEQ